MPGRARFEPYLEPLISVSHSRVGGAKLQRSILAGYWLSTVKIESTLKESDMICAGASNQAHGRQTWLIR
jgi:hypothetical protein